MGLWNLLSGRRRHFDETAVRYATECIRRLDQFPAQLESHRDFLFSLVSETTYTLFGIFFGPLRGTFPRTSARLKSLPHATFARLHRYLYAIWHASWRAARREQGMTTVGDDRGLVDYAAYALGCEVGELRPMIDRFEAGERRVVGEMTDILGLVLTAQMKDAPEWVLELTIWTQLTTFIITEAHESRGQARGRRYADMWAQAHARLAARSRQTAFAPDDTQL